MEHQPYENWILSGDPLSPSQKSDLMDHISTCSHCASIYEGIAGVEDLLKCATFESPSPGFTQRFQMMAARRKEEARRLQSYLFLGWMMLVTVVISMGYLTTLLLIQSPAEVVSNIMASTINMAFQLDSLLQLVKTWMQIIPLPITLAIIAGSAGLVVLLTSGWIFSIWKISAQGVKTNE
ncbi:MAG: hypothetical protein GYA15_15790 [Leptolinea sp.]|jgi:hypothetical protein|nr:hypothetical protein [Leptolinea sp.]